MHTPRTFLLSTLLLALPTLAVAQESDEAEPTPEEAVAEEAATEEAVVEEAAAEEPAAEEAPKAEVSLTAEAGVVFLYGNTKSVSANGAVNFGVKHLKNQFGLVVGAAYGRGVVADTDTWETTATKVFGTARYDRFLSDINSLYVLGGALHDPFANLTLQARGDVGYSHVLVNTDVHHLIGEAGFNYTHDRYVLNDPMVQHFFGARLFAGYKLTPSDTFGFSQSVEALVGGTDNTDARFDGRMTAITAVTANATKILAVKFGFTLNWDFVPPEGTEPLDTTTMLTLVATLM